LNPRGAGGLALLLAVSAGGEAKAAVNLLSNGGVETESELDPAKPAAWTADAWGDAQASFDWVFDSEGDHYLRADVSEISTGDAKWLSGIVPVHETKVVVGDVYRGEGESVLVVQARGDNLESKWITASVLTGSVEWSEARGVVVLPTWTTSIRVAHLLATTGWIETDDYYLTPASAVDHGVLEDARPKVSISFDDGWVSEYYIAVPILAEFSFKATFYIVSDWVDKPAFQGDYMTSYQLAKLAEAGHEIGCHSRTHADLTQAADKHTQIVESKEALGFLGFKTVGFAPPMGAFDDVVLKLVSANYDYMRTIEKGLNKEPYDRYALRAMVVTNFTTQEQIKTWVDLSAAEGSWLILVYHRLAIEATGEIYTTPEEFRKTLEYLAASDADVQPIGKVLGSWTPESYADYGEKDLQPVGFDPPDSFDEDSAGCALSSIPAHGAGPLFTICLLVPMLVGRAKATNGAHEDPTDAAVGPCPLP